MTSFSSSALRFSAIDYYFKQLIPGEHSSTTEAETVRLWTSKQPTVYQRPVEGSNDTVTFSFVDGPLNQSQETLLMQEGYEKRTVEDDSQLLADQLALVTRLAQPNADH